MLTLTKCFLCFREEGTLVRRTLLHCLVSRRLEEQPPSHHKGATEMGSVPKLGGHQGRKVGENHLFQLDTFTVHLELPAFPGPLVRQGDVVDRPVNHQGVRGDLSKLLLPDPHEVSRHTRENR
jgi:hypothetical protein